MVSPSPTPTAKLDKANMKKYDLTNFNYQPVAFPARDGRMLRFRDKVIKKFAYTKQTELGLYNPMDRIPCPIQTDPTKFQRKDCFAITDKSRFEVIYRLIEITSNNPIILQMPMPYCPSQQTIVYIERESGSSAMFHLNGDLWSAIKYDINQIEKLLQDPRTIMNPPLYNK